MWTRHSLNAQPTSLCERDQDSDHVPSEMSVRSSSFPSVAETRGTSRFVTQDYISAPTPSSKSQFIRQLVLTLTAIMGFCSLSLVFSAGKLAIVPTVLSSILIVLAWKQRKGRILYFST